MDTQTFKFDARTLALGWLATSLASSNDDDRPALYRTVHVECFSTGMRLLATDSYMLLRSWIHPDLIVARLGKLGKLYPETPITWTFGGHDKAALVEVLRSEPSVVGLVMPVRVALPTLEADEPAESS